MVLRPLSSICLRPLQIGTYVCTALLGYTIHKVRLYVKQIVFVKLTEMTCLDMFSGFEDAIPVLILAILLFAVVVYSNLLLPGSCHFKVGVCKSVFYTHISIFFHKTHTTFSGFQFSAVFDLCKDLHY